MDYPVTEKFDTDTSLLNLTEQGRQVRARMLSHINDYEHGTGDPTVLLTPEHKTLLAGGMEVVEGQEGPELQQSLRRVALETLSSMYYDLLVTYWLFCEADPEG